MRVKPKTSSGKINIFGNITILPPLLLWINEVEEQNPILRNRRERAQKEDLLNFSIGSKEVLRFQNRIYVLRNDGLRKYLKKCVGQDIPFTRVSIRCIMI